MISTDFVYVVLFPDSEIPDVHFERDDVVNALQSYLEELLQTNSSREGITKKSILDFMKFIKSFKESTLGPRLEVLDFEVDFEGNTTFPLSKTLSVRIVKVPEKYADCPRCE